MNKKEKERWKEFLALEKGISYERHLDETKRLAGENMTIMVNKYPLSVWGLMTKQIKFLAWKIWLLQGMALAALCGIFLSVYGGTAFHRSEWAGARFLCGSGVVIAACTVPVLQRSLRYGMYELECSTRFSVRGGLAAQLLFIGIGDGGMLAALAVLASRCGTGGSVIFLFGVIPFLTALVTVLMLWMRQGASISAGRMLLFCGGAVLPVYEMLVFASRQFPTGIVGFGICYALLCAGMIVRLYRKIFLRERERELLWKLY